MGKYQLPLWLPLAVLFAIGFLGFVIPSWTDATVRLGKLAGITESWAGFAGAIIAACLTITATIGAAVAAWFAVRAQISAPKEASKRAQAEAKFIGVVALTQPIHAATALLYAVQVARAANTPAAQTQWDGVVTQACNQVKATLDHFALREISAELSPDDRVLFLIIILQLSSIVNIHSNQFGLVTRDQRLENMETQLSGLEKFLPLFDNDLHNAFQRDSRLPGTR